MKTLCASTLHFSRRLVCSAVFGWRGAAGHRGCPAFTSPPSGFPIGGEVFALRVEEHGNLPLRSLSSQPSNSMTQFSFPKVTLPRRQA
jgi:hypothetical protein